MHKPEMSLQSISKKVYNKHIKTQMSQPLDFNEIRN